MLEFNIKGVKVSFGYLFFAVITAVLLIDKTGICILGLIACLWHEVGHLSAFMLKKAKPLEISFLAGGIRIKPSRELTGNDKIFVLAAGPLFNLTAAGLLADISPVFAAVNIVIGVFNLLPVSPLDGGGILSVYLIQKFERSDLIMKAVSLMCCVFLAAAGIYVFYRSHNITLIITSCYLAVLLLCKTYD